MAKRRGRAADGIGQSLEGAERRLVGEGEERRGKRCGCLATKMRERILGGCS